MSRNLYDLEKPLNECKTNSCIMSILFDAGLLKIEQSEFLYKDPHLIKPVYLKKVEGMLIGTAIGDALGSSVEGTTPRKGIAELRGYLPRAHITDDTQLTFWTLEVFLKHNWLNPKALADRYTKERIIGIGRTVKYFIKNYKDLKVPWYLAGGKSAGNGALMKLSPVVIPHLLEPSKELWSDAVITTYLIYHDKLAISSAVAFTNLLWELMKINRPPEPEWWLEEYVRVVRELEGDNSLYQPRSGMITYTGPAWYFIEKILTKALNEGWSLHDLSKTVGSGAYLLETIPMVLYTLMCYGENPFEALVNAVTYSKDSDTIGAIVGYLLGALYGVRAFPRHLLEPVIKGELLPTTFLKLVQKTEDYLLAKEKEVYGSNTIVNTENTIIYRPQKSFLKNLF